MKQTVEDFAKKLKEEDWFYPELINNMSQKEADDAPKILLEAVKKEAENRNISLIDETWNYEDYFRDVITDHILSFAGQ